MPRYIFDFAALHHVQDDPFNGLVGASEVSHCAHEWLPPICRVNDDFFLEGLPMYLRQSMSTCLSHAPQSLIFPSQTRVGQSVQCIWSVQLSPIDSHTPLRLFAALSRSLDARAFLHWLPIPREVHQSSSRVAYFQDRRISVYQPFRRDQVYSPVHT